VDIVFFPVADNVPEKKKGKRKGKRETKGRERRTKRESVFLFAFSPR